MCVYAIEHLFSCWLPNAFINLELQPMQNANNDLALVTELLRDTPYQRCSHSCRWFIILITSERFSLEAINT